MMRIGLFLLLFFCLTTPILAKQHQSVFGFPFDVSEDWLVLSQKLVKQALQQSNTAALELDKTDLTLTDDTLLQIKRGDAEILFDKKHSSSTNKNKILLQKAVGQTSRDSKQLKNKCAQLEKTFKAEKNSLHSVKNCELRKAAGKSYSLIEYFDTQRKIQTMQSEFQLSHNVVIVAIALANEQHLSYVRETYQQLLNAIGNYINNAPDYFQLLDSGLADYKNASYKEAFDKFKQVAEIGDMNGQYNLGLMYSEGKGVNINIPIAIQYYRKAAEQGHTLAMNNLATAYLQGRGIEKDELKAAQMFKQAAMSGLHIAQNSYGGLLLNGTGVKQDTNEAVKWFLRAAEQGNPHAIKNLITIFEQEAKIGNTEAMHNLGTLYLQTGESQSALHWLEKAAGKGEQRSREALVKLYSEGLMGIKKDLNKAKRWSN